MLTGAVYVCLVLEQEHQVCSEDRFTWPDKSMSAYIQTE